MSTGGGLAALGSTNVKGEPPTMTVEEERDRRCRALGIPGGSQALYSIVVESVGDPKRLVSRKLTAETLLSLGYTKEGMQQIGYNEETLGVLGYIQKKRPETKGLPPSSDKSLLELIETCDANQLKSMGFVVHHLRQFGQGPFYVSNGHKIYDGLGRFALTSWWKRLPNGDLLSHSYQISQFMTLNHKGTTVQWYLLVLQR
jgi:hypothetical protein